MLKNIKHYAVLADKVKNNVRVYESVVLYSTIYSMTLGLKVQGYDCGVYVGGLRLNASGHGLV